MRAGGRRNLGKVHGNKQQVTAPEKGKIAQRFLKEYSQRTETWTQRNTLLELGGMRCRRNIRRHLMVCKAAAGAVVRAMI